MEEYSTETLLKRKRLATWLLWLMFLASISACVVAAITLFAGKRNIRKELDRRA